MRVKEQLRPSGMRMGMAWKISEKWKGAGGILSFTFTSHVYESVNPSLDARNSAWGQRNVKRRACHRRAEAADEDED